MRSETDWGWFVLVSQSVSSVKQNRPLGQAVQIGHTITSVGTFRVPDSSTADCQTNRILAFVSHTTVASNFLDEASPPLTPRGMFEPNLPN